MCLSSIFYNNKSILFSNRVDFIHLCRLPIQMYCHNCFGSVRNFIHNPFRINIKIIFFRFYKNWCCPSIRYCQSRCDKCIGRYDYLVAFFDSICLQCKKQCIQTISTSDTVLCSAICGKFFFKCSHLRSLNEPVFLIYLLHFSKYFIFYFIMHFFK